MSYKVLDVLQGTPEWLRIRYQFVTASQAPVLFDLSPYQTRLGLFEEKLFQVETQNTKGKEILFARGHSAEAAGRIYLEQKLGLDLPPTVLVSTEHPYLMASLDGFSSEKNVIFEAKFVGTEALNAVRAGNIPPHHLCQMQASMLVSKTDKCLYFVTDPSGDSHLQEVAFDARYADEIAQAAKAFMEGVLNGEPPEPGEKDFHVVHEDLLFRRYSIIDADIKALEAEKAGLKKKLIQKYKDHRRVRCENVSMVYSVRKGPVDYETIPVLKGIDLEKYRKPSTEVVTLKIDKPKALRGVA